MADCSKVAWYCRQWAAIRHLVALKLLFPLPTLPSLPLPSTESGQAQRKREEKKQKLAERQDKLRQLFQEEQLSYEVVKSCAL